MIDLSKAKSGDKVRFSGGSSAIVDTVKFMAVDVELGGVYDVKFQDGTNAAFTQNGKPYSEQSYFDDSHPFGDLSRGYDITSIRTPHPTRKPLQLSRAFNLASKRTGDQHSRHPALEFQTINHLRGIAGRYKIPGNVTAPEYEDMTSKKIRNAVAEANGGVAVWRVWDILEKMPPPDFLKQSWNKLVRLNPVLKGVHFDKANAEEMYNVHLGVTSGFNVDDINFFLEQKKVGEGLPAKQAREMPVHGDRLARIDRIATQPMYWVASPKTAETVEERLLRRKKQEKKAEQKRQSHPSRGHAQQRKPKAS